MPTIEPEDIGPMPSQPVSPEVWLWQQLAQQQAAEAWSQWTSGQPLPAVLPPKKNLNYKTPLPPPSVQDIGETLQDYEQAGGRLNITPGEWRAYGRYVALFSGNSDPDLSEKLVPVLNMLENEPGLAQAMQSILMPGSMGLTPEAWGIVLALSDDDSGELADLLRSYVPTERLIFAPGQTSYLGFRAWDSAAPYGWQYIPLSEVGGTWGMTEFTDYLKDPFYICVDPTNPNFGNMERLSKIPALNQSWHYIGVESGKIKEETIILGMVPLQTPQVLFLSPDGTEWKIHPSDIEQGYIGDCYFMASLAAVADRNPDTIESAIRDNGDGTYTVTLYKKQKGKFVPVEITVRGPLVPVAYDKIHNSYIAFHAFPGDTQRGDTEVWPLVMENAYAQRVGGRAGAEAGYPEIVGGWPADSLEMITGQESREYHDPSDISLDRLKQLYDQNHAIVPSTSGDIERNNLYGLEPSHSYYVVGVNTTAGTVIIRNPWGWGFPPIEIPYNEFENYFDQIVINPIWER